MSQDAPADFDKITTAADQRLDKSKDDPLAPFTGTDKDARLARSRAADCEFQSSEWQQTADKYVVDAENRGCGAGQGHPQKAERKRRATEVSGPSVEERLAALKSQLLKIDSLVTKAQSIKTQIDASKTGESEIVDVTGVLTRETDFSPKPGTEWTPAAGRNQTTTDSSSDSGLLTPDFRFKTAAQTQSSSPGLRELESKQDSVLQTSSAKLKPPPIPPRNIKPSATSLSRGAGHQQEVNRAFNINNGLEVRLHLADVRTVKADALVYVDASLTAASRQSVTITDVDQADENYPFHRRIISTSPVVVHPLTDPDAKLNKLISAYDVIWSGANEKQISSIALSMVLGKPCTRQVSASAICQSLVKLSADPTGSSIREVNIADTTTEILNYIIQKFEEIASKDETTITEVRRDQQTASQSDLDEKCQIPGGGPRYFNPYGNVMDFYVTKTDPVIGDAISIGNHPEVESSTAPGPFGTTFRDEVSDNTAVHAGDKQLEVKHPVGAEYDDINFNDTAATTGVIITNCRQPVYTNLDDGNKISDPTELSPDELTDSSFSSDESWDNEAVSDAKPNTAECTSMEQPFKIPGEIPKTPAALMYDQVSTLPEVDGFGVASNEQAYMNEPSGKNEHLNKPFGRRNEQMEPPEDLAYEEVSVEQAVPSVAVQTKERENTNVDISVEMSEQTTTSQSRTTPKINDLDSNIGQPQYTNVEDLFDPLRDSRTSTNNRESTASAGVLYDEVNVGSCSNLPTVTTDEANSQDEAYEHVEDNFEKEEQFGRPSCDMLYEDVYLDGARQPADDLSAEYASVVNVPSLQSCSSPEIYERIDDKAAFDAPPATKITNSCKQFVQRPTEVEFPAGFVVGGSLKLVVYMHDLTKLKVDVIVNPTDGLLEVNGSVSKRLLEAAGSFLLEDLRMIIADSGPVKETEVVETLGGNLYCRHILHAVLPICPRRDHAGSKQQQEYLYDLRTTIENVLRNANSVGARSIAIPPFVPDSNPELARRFAEKLCDAVIAESQKTKGEGGAVLEQIHVVSKSPEFLAALVAHCLSVHWRRGTMTPMAYSDIQNAFKVVGADVSRPTAFRPAAFKVGKYSTVVIHACNIAQMHVDAIVSSDTSQLEHADGVARVICEAAGSAMAVYLMEIIEHQASVGISEVVETPPGRLPCHVVLHAVPPRWPDTDRASDTTYCLMQLKRTLDNAFELARQNGVTSIAIPPIGTGLCKVPPVHVAEEMYKSVVDNERHQQSVGGSVREIHFVDMQPGVLKLLVDLFENGCRDTRPVDVTITSAHTETSVKIDKVLGRSASNGTGTAPNNQPVTRAQPQSAALRRNARVGAPSNAFVPMLNAAAVGAGELDQPAGYLLHDDQLEINVQVFIYLADITALRTDAIVNPTDSRLRQHRGISQVIAGAAGSQWKKDCQKAIGACKIPVSGVVNTGAGDLPCRRVLHVVTPKWSIQALSDPKELSELRSLMLSSLENVFFVAAESESMTTVALPPIGSGKGPAAAHFMAEILFHSLLRHASVRLLREIHIVDTKTDVLSALKRKLNDASMVHAYGLQVSPLGTEVEAAIRRVAPPSATATSNASGISEDNDDELYSEIPIGSNQPPKKTANWKTKTNRVTERLAKMLIHKRHANADGGRKTQTGSLPCPLPPRPHSSSSYCEGDQSPAVLPPRRAPSKD